MRLSSEERSHIHQRVNSILDDGSPHLVYTMRINLLVYEHGMLLRNQPPGWRSREDELNHEGKKLIRNYERSGSGPRLQVVQRGRKEACHEPN